MIESIGDLDPDIADNANVPVNVWLMQITENGAGDSLCRSDADPDWATWVLTADNYMPRKARVTQDAYRIVATSREELAAIVRDSWMPLYELAAGVMREICEGTQTHLYYWERDDS
jgi:hypothetical protein